MQNLIKQDINFLDKPLWMVDVKNDGLGSVWHDNGFEYRTGYRVPDNVDMLILLYLLLKSQMLNYSKKIVLSRYEILKKCNVSTNKQYYLRLEDSLKRWENVSVSFNGIFFEKGKHVTIGFGIIDDYEIDEETKVVEINFNENWLLKIQQSDFFKYINFEYYKRIKRPVSRRLYEILIKNFKGRDECYYKLTNLGTKLTLSGVQSVSF